MHLWFLVLFGIWYAFVVAPVTLHVHGFWPRACVYSLVYKSCIIFPHGATVEVWKWISNFIPYFTHRDRWQLIHAVWISGSFKRLPDVVVANIHCGDDERIHRSRKPACEIDDSFHHKLHRWWRKNQLSNMKMSWHRNAFRIFGPLRGESVGHRWIPLTKGRQHDA